MIDAWQQRPWVVVPTYNERDNLVPLLKALSAWPALSVLIVDDTSPDGTGQLAEQLRQQYPKLQVLHRPSKQGLGPAYRQGLQTALDHGATAVVHCDADLSHDLTKIPVMLNRLRDADLVIGSRYISGGTMNIAWYRQWISVLGNRYLQMLLGFGVDDWSSGFKAWRAPVLQRVLQQPLSATGYACLMEMTWWARKIGARIIEEPIVFVDRTVGQSKFSWQIMWEDIRLAMRLRR